MKNYYFNVTIKERVTVSAHNKKKALTKLKEQYLENSGIELEDYEIKEVK